MVGGDGTILHTADGGQSWQRQVSETREYLTSVTFTADGQRGWAVGLGGAILHTADGGQSWQGQVSGTGTHLNSVIFMVDDQRGWVVGSDSTILLTVNGGKSWQSIAYRMFPAPWFYVVLVLIALVYFAAFGWRVWQIRQTGKQTSFRSCCDRQAGGSRRSRFSRCTAHCCRIGAFSDQCQNRTTVDAGGHRRLGLRQELVDELFIHPFET